MANVIQLSGAAVPVTVSAGGYELYAPGLVGTVEELDVAEVATRAAGSPHETALLQALAEADMVPIRQFEITAPMTVPIVGSTRASGTPTTRDGAPAMVLQLPDLGTETNAALLQTDEAGVSRWIFPVPFLDSTAGTRGGSAGLTFHLPLQPALLPPSADSTVDETRGMLGKIGRRVVRVLAWSAGGLIGRGIDATIGAWERGRRPHLIRPFPTGAVADAAMPWGPMARGRSLMFIHGTFSAASSAFSQLPAAVLEALAKRYEGRLFAFDHPSLGVSPLENAQAFFDAAPEGAQLELDVVAHSRGGLVTRELAAPSADLRAGSRRITIRKAVLVGVPNRGTPLADGMHAIDLIDRYTNLLTALPDDAFTLTFEVVLAVVKLFAEGFTTGLPGLHSMLPKGNYLRRINSGPASTTQYFAAASAFAPTVPGLLGRLGSFAAGRFIDSVFEEESDGVVPTIGVYDGTPGAASFPIPAERRIVFGGGDGVHHCNYFANTRLQQQIVTWLTAADE